MDATTIAVPETVATVHVTAYKYNSEQPNTVIPDATYELLAQGTAPREHRVRHRQHGGPERRRVLG